MKSKLIILLVIAGILSLMACNKKVADKSKSTAKKETKAKKEDVKKDDAFVIVEFRKTPCYGKCPYFNAAIYSDGTATYEGLKFVDRLGKYEAKVDTTIINEIQRRAHAIKYCKLAATYPEDGRKIVDLPMTITYIKVGEHEHKIKNKIDAPKKLGFFEMYLNSVFEGLDWKKVDNKD